MAVSGSLRIVGQSFPKNKDRARESIMNAVAHSAARADVSSRRQFAFAIVQAALIMVSILGLMAGAAAAAGVDLTSVPRRVVDTLAEPLPLSAESLKDHGVIKQRQGEPGSASGGTGSKVGQPVERAAVEGDRFTLARGGSRETSEHDTNQPGHSGPTGQTNPAGNSRRFGNPTQVDAPGRGANAPGNDPPGGGNRSAHQGIQPGTTDPSGNTGRHDDQPGSGERSGSDSPNTQVANETLGQNDSSDNGANGDRENPPTHELGNGSIGQNTGDSGESNSGDGSASGGPR